jgi:hypothetical protein
MAMIKSGDKFIKEGEEKGKKISLSDIIKVGLAGVPVIGSAVIASEAISRVGDYVESKSIENATKKEVSDIAAQPNLTTPELKETAKGAFTTGVAPEVKEKAIKELSMPGEQERIKEQSVKGQNVKPMDQLKEAFMHFGPQILASVLVGPEAAAQTGKLLEGYRKELRSKEEMALKKDELALKEKALGMKEKAIGASKLAELQKLSEKGKKDLEKRELDYMATIDELNTFKDSIKALKKGSLTGHYDSTVQAELDRSALAGKEGIDRASARRNLMNLRVSDALKRISKTKGAISDREMKLFLEPAPSMKDQEGVWVNWVNNKVKIIEKLEKFQRDKIKGIDPTKKFETEKRKDIDFYLNKYKR